MDDDTKFYLLVLTILAATLIYWSGVHIYRYFTSIVMAKKIARMKPIKLSKNVEFEVIYADGTRKRVREGVLFEVEGNRLTLHNGTNRKEVLFAIPTVCIKAIDDAGLMHDLEKYLNRKGGKNK